MGEFSRVIFSVATAIVGVAIVAVIVSKQSNTTGVISAAADGFSQALKIAVSPVTASH